MIRIGFTGTQQGMTWKQGLAVQARLAAVSNFGQDPPGVPVQRHHGCCVGADEEFHNMRVEKTPATAIVLHPPTDKHKMADIEAAHYIVRLAAKPYLERNRDIVDQTDELWATPRQYNMRGSDGAWVALRSGTWSTIRYAESIGKRVVIIWPNGATTVKEAT